MTEAQAQTGNDGTDRRWPRRLVPKAVLIVQRILGDDGYRAVRARNFTLPSLSLFALSIMADLSELLGDISLMGLKISMAVVLVLGALVVFRTRFCRACAYPLVVAFLFTLGFATLIGIQNAFAATEDGVIAKYVPGASQVQAELFKLAVLTFSTVEETREDVARIDVRTELLVEQNREILERLEQIDGISPKVLTAILVRLGARADISEDEIPQFLAKIANDYKLLEERLGEIDGSDEKLASIRLAAGGEIETGAFDAARARIAQARKSMRKERLDAAAREAALIVDEAKIDVLDARILPAADKFTAAARLVEFDRPATFNYKWAAALTHFAHGVDFGSLVSLYRAVFEFEALFADDIPIDEPEARARALADYGHSLLVLGERTGDVARLEKSVGIYEQALAELPEDAVAETASKLGHEHGTALQALGRTSGDLEHLERSEAALTQTIAGMTPQSSEREWALAHLTLAKTQEAMVKITSQSADFESALTAYSEAGKYLSAASEPEHVADLYFSMARMVYEFADGEPKLYDYALDAVTNGALAVSDREKRPLAWAQRQALKAGILLKRGQSTGSLSDLEQAVSAFDEALEELTTSRSPLEWGKAQSARGAAMSSLAQAKGDAAGFNEAAASFNRALGVLTPEIDEAAYMAANGGLADALTALSELADDPSLIDLALSAARHELDAARRLEDGSAEARAEARIVDLEARLAPTPGRANAVSVP